MQSVPNTKQISMHVTETTLTNACSVTEGETWNFQEKRKSRTSETMLTCYRSVRTITAKQDTCIWILYNVQTELSVLHLNLFFW